MQQASGKTALCQTGAAESDALRAQLLILWNQMLSEQRDAVVNLMMQFVVK